MSLNLSFSKMHLYQMLHLGMNILNHVSISYLMDIICICYHYLLFHLDIHISCKWNPKQNYFYKNKI